MFCISESTWLQTPEANNRFARVKEMNNGEAYQDHITYVVRRNTIHYNRVDKGRTLIKIALSRIDFRHSQACKRMVLTYEWSRRVLHNPVYMYYEKNF